MAFQYRMNRKLWLAVLLLGINILLAFLADDWDGWSLLLVQFVGLGLGITGLVLVFRGASELRRSRE